MRCPGDVGFVVDSRCYIVALLFDCVLFGVVPCRCVVLLLWVFPECCLLMLTCCCVCVVCVLDVCSCVAIRLLF